MVSRFLESTRVEIEQEQLLGAQVAPWPARADSER
jgi:hypothetical protein